LTARALRFLARYGVFEEVSPGVFANNAASRLLRNQPGGMRNFAPQSRKSTVPCRPSLQVGIIDITMLALFGEARQRTEEEYRALFGSCNLALARVIPTESAFSIVEAKPV